MEDYSFAFKQFVSFFVHPYGLVVSLSFLFVIFKILRWKRYANTSLYSMVFFLLFFSYPPVANSLISSLEIRHPKFDYTHQVEYIHVLGNGHNDDESQPLSSRIGDVGTKRNLEGIMIYYKSPGSKIIFTGARGGSPISTAMMNKKFALALGVKEEDIILSEIQNDTEDEALFAKSVVGDAPFALVTSATHMDRAMKLFQLHGLDPIAAPTGYLKQNVQSYLKLPHPSSFIKSQIAMHEYIGLLWGKLKSIF